MSVGTIIAIYIEIGLVLAIVEPVLWKFMKLHALEIMDENLAGKSKAYRKGYVTGLLFSIVTGWPIHLITWYVIDPIMAKRQESKKET